MNVLFGVHGEMPPYNMQMEPELENEIKVTRATVSSHKDAFLEFYEWETMELNFRADFLMIDKHMYQTSTEEASLDRELLCNRVWGSATLGWEFPDMETCDIWSRRLPPSERQQGLDFFLQILQSWQTCPAEVRELKCADSEPTHKQLDTKAAVAIHFYVQQFIDIFNRFPVAPGGFPSRFALVLEALNKAKNVA